MDERRLRRESQKIAEQMAELLGRYPNAQAALERAFLLGVVQAAVQARYGAESPLTVGVLCPSCGTNIIVMPAQLSKAVGDWGGTEVELQFLEQIKTDKAKTGDRLAIADVARRYTCPECGHDEQLPPEDELRRLAEEQRRPAEGDEA
jgi:predicted RNA-binding Zn-ribbon protein involved in translation (DUF1610 family)